MKRKPPRPSEASLRRYSLPPAVVSEPWMVFVSSAMPRQKNHPILKERRLAAAVARGHSHGFRVWTWEDCGFPGAFAPKELFVEQATKAQLLILLIHNRLTRNTKSEYRASVRAKRSQMILFRDGCRLEPGTRTFKKTLRTKTYSLYRNRSELRTLITRGLTSNVWLYANRGLEIGTSSTYAPTSR